MGRGRRRGHQPAVKGFRPGKEPPHLKAQRAKAQMGSDASWAQKQAVDAVAGRSPSEVQGMVKKWSTGLFAGGAVLGIAGVFLYGVAVPAGVAVHVLAAVCLFLGFRVRKSGQGLVDLAGSI